MVNIDEFLICYKKQLKILVLLLFLGLVSLWIFIPRIIPIPGSKVYGKEIFAECYVVINPPKDIDELNIFIKKYDLTHPVHASTPPTDIISLNGYSRTFYRESRTFHRFIRFSDAYNLDDILTEDYNSRDRIGFIYASTKKRKYSIRLLHSYFSAFGWNTYTEDELDYEEEFDDPTLNGLYNNVPEHMIPDKA